MWFLGTRINAVSVLEHLQEASLKGRHSTLRPLGGDWVPSWEFTLRKCSLEHRGPCEFSFLSGEMNISWGHLTLIHPAHQGYPSGSNMAHLDSTLSQPSVSSIVACWGWNNCQRLANPLWGRPRDRGLLDCIKCRVIFSFWIIILALSPVLKSDHNS